MMPIKPSQQHDEQQPPSQCSTSKSLAVASLTNQKIIKFDPTRAPIRKVASALFRN